MNEIPLGKIIDGEQHRDAIHIAVAPVIAAERLVPGGHIGFVGGDTERVTARAKVLLGVVDPFLTNIVEHGQKFFMFLYPQTITSLRHDWTHPAFESVAPAVDPKAESERWLREYCESVDVSYGLLMASITEGKDQRFPPCEGYSVGSLNPGYLTIYGEDAYGGIPSELWKHAETVIGHPLRYHPAAFSCSC